jgi:hypothetical protein
MQVKLWSTDKSIAHTDVPLSSWLVTIIHILFPRKPVEPVMRMVFPLKNPLILAASMLSVIVADRLYSLSLSLNNLLEIAGK